MDRAPAVSVSDEDLRRRIPRRFAPPTASAAAAAVRPLRPADGTPAFVLDARRTVAALGLFARAPSHTPSPPPSPLALESASPLSLSSAPLAATAVVAFTERLFVFRPAQQLTLMRAAAGGAPALLVAANRVLLDEAARLMPLLGRFLLVIDVGFSTSVRANSFVNPYDAAIFNHQVVMLDAGTDASVEPPMLHMLCELTTQCLAWQRADPSNCVLLLAASPVHLACGLACQLIANHAASPFRFDSLSAAAVAGVRGSSRDMHMVALLDWVFRATNAPSVLLRAALAGQALIERPQLSGAAASSLAALEEEEETRDTERSGTGDGVAGQSSIGKGFLVRSDPSGRPGIALIVTPENRVFYVRGVLRFDPRSSAVASYGTGLGGGGSGPGEDRTAESAAEVEALGRVTALVGSGSQRSLSASASGLGASAPPSGGSPASPSPASGPASSSSADASTSTDDVLPPWLTVPVLQQVLAFRSLAEHHSLTLSRPGHGPGGPVLHALLLAIVTRRSRAASGMREIGAEAVAPAIRPRDVSATAVFLALLGSVAPSAPTAARPASPGHSSGGHRVGSVAAPSNSGDSWERPRRSGLSSGVGFEAPLAAFVLPPSFFSVPRALRAEDACDDNGGAAAAPVAAALTQSAFARSVLLRAPPSDWRQREFAPVVLRYISLSRAPLVQTGEVAHLETGCCPAVMVLAFEPSGGLRLLHSSMVQGRRRFRHDHGPIIIPVNAVVRGEFLVRVFDMGNVGAGSKLFSFRYHAGILEPQHHNSQRSAVGGASAIPQRGQGEPPLDKWATLVHVSQRQAGLDVDDARFDREFHCTLAVSELPARHAKSVAAGVPVVPPPRLAKPGPEPTPDLDVRPDRLFVACHTPGCGALLHVPESSLDAAAAVAELKHERLKAQRDRRLEETSLAAAASDGRDCMPAKLVVHDWDDLTEGEADAILLRRRPPGAAPRFGAFAAASTASADWRRVLQEREARAVRLERGEPEPQSDEEVFDEADDGPVFSAPWVPLAERAAAAAAADAFLLEQQLADDVAAPGGKPRKQRWEAQPQTHAHAQARAHAHAADAPAAEEFIGGDLAIFHKNGPPFIPRPGEGSDRPPHSRLITCSSCAALVYVSALAAVLAGRVPLHVACAPQIPSVDARVKGFGAGIDEQPSDEDDDGKGAEARSAALAASRSGSQGSGRDSHADVAAASHPFDVPASSDASQGVAFQAMLAARERQKRADSRRLTQLSGMFPQLDPVLIEDEFLRVIARDGDFDDVVNLCMAHAENLDKRGRTARAGVEAATRRARQARDVRLARESREEAALIRSQATGGANGSASDPASPGQLGDGNLPADASHTASGPRDVFVQDERLFAVLPLKLGLLVASRVGKGAVVGLRLRALPPVDQEEAPPVGIGRASAASAAAARGGGFGRRSNSTASSAARSAAPSTLNTWEVDCEVMSVAVELPWAIAFCAPQSLTLMTETTEAYEEAQRRKLVRRAARRMRRAAAGRPPSSVDSRLGRATAALATAQATLAAAQAARAALVGTGKSKEARAARTAADEAIEAAEARVEAADAALTVLGRARSGADAAVAARTCDEQQRVRSGVGSQRQLARRESPSSSDASSWDSALDDGPQPPHGGQGGGGSSGSGSGLSGFGGGADEAEDADMAFARRLQMQELAEALDDEGAAPDDERRGGSFAAELALQQAVLRVAGNSNTPDSRRAAAAARRARRRRREQRPAYATFPSRCVVDATVLRALAPHVTLADALPPPRVACIYAVGAPRPPRPLVPEALARTGAAAAGGSGHGGGVRDSFLRARVEGTAFDRVSGKGVASLGDFQSLPIFVFGEGGASGGGAGGDENMCVICRDDKEAGDRLRRLPCGHAWHVRCVDAWLLIDARCPLCLRPVGGVLFGAASEQAEAAEEAAAATPRG